MIDVKTSATEILLGASLFKYDDEGKLTKFMYQTYNFLGKEILEIDKYLQKISHYLKFD